VALPHLIDLSETDFVLDLHDRPLQAIPRELEREEEDQTLESVSTAE
jgi:hypothetical protein